MPSKQREVCFAICFAGGFLLELFLVFSGVDELYKSQTFVTRDCRVRSMDVDCGNRAYYPVWNVTVLFWDRGTDESIRALYGSSSKSDAWVKANAYAVLRSTAHVRFAFCSC
jgi:hypothetical protein